MFRLVKHRQIGITVQCVCGFLSVSDAHAYVRSPLDKRSLVMGSCSDSTPSMQHSCLPIWPSSDPCSCLFSAFRHYKVARGATLAPSGNFAIILIPTDFIYTVLPFVQHFSWLYRIILLHNRNILATFCSVGDCTLNVFLECRTTYFHSVLEADKSKLQLLKIILRVEYNIKSSLIFKCWSHYLKVWVCFHFYACVFYHSCISHIVVSGLPTCGNITL